MSAIPDNTNKTYVGACPQSDGRTMYTILQTGTYYAPPGHEEHHLVKEGQWSYEGGDEWARTVKCSCGKRWVQYDN